MLRRVQQVVDEELVEEQQMVELLESVGWKIWIDWVVLFLEKRDGVEIRAPDRLPRENHSSHFL